MAGRKSAPQSQLPGGDCHFVLRRFGGQYLEVAIKHRLEKLPITPQIFRDETRNAGATLLPIADIHTIATTEVPLRHRDPFDRLLLATAQTEHLVLLTGDEGLLRLTRLEPTLPVKPTV